ncbi:DUF2865 domain-containing protein [Stappia sp. ES.058]|uniref:DUF2865 domain-containing protein n=1 Tax=Stappia sp. ES.058 TaxID=1881061 RepID=UPI00087B6E0F|nr:DUF2865 domain-containing protein [Stappia sp. ES.058]SDU17074.1 Protein of unknown function [Stappia sp. ES.058]
MTGPYAIARSAGLAVLAGATLVLVATPGQAASCNALRAEISRIAAGSAQSPAYRKWSAAAEQQKAALGLAQRDARHLGCNGAASAGSCNTLTGKIKRMRANLAKIERQRDRRAQPGQARRKRQLERTLANQGCDRTRTAKKGGGLLALFGIGRRDGANDAVTTASSLQSATRSSVTITSAQPDFTTSQPSGPTYRTMCVRTCDGFYFPVSFSTGSEGFGRDTAICRSMCPGAEAQLYVHRNPGETVDNLVSVEGLPYTDLPNAYRFRKTYVSGCGCQPKPGGRQSMASLIRSGDAVAAQSLRDTQGSGGLGIDSLRETLATPVASRADAVPDGADPDTRMNVELGFAPQPASMRLPVLGGTGTSVSGVAKSADAVDDGSDVQTAPATVQPKQNVRIIGPRYFVAQ